MEPDQGTHDDETGDRDLRSAFDAVVLDWENVSVREMFGCPCYMAAGTLFAVLVTEADGVVLTRLPDTQLQRLESEFETGPFRSGDWHVSKWTQVSVEDTADLEELLPYVETSYRSGLEAF